MNQTDAVHPIRIIFNKVDDVMDDHFWRACDCKAAAKLILQTEALIKVVPTLKTGATEDSITAATSATCKQIEESFPGKADASDRLEAYRAIIHVAIHVLWKAGYRVNEIQHATKTDEARVYRYLEQPISDDPSFRLFRDAFARFYFSRPRTANLSSTGSGNDSLPL